MNFEAKHHAERLQEIRKSGANDGDFLREIEEELRSVLLPTLLTSCESIVKIMQSLAHGIIFDPARTDLLDLRVGYSHQAIPEPGELSMVVFQLTTSVVTVAEGAAPLPAPPITDSQTDIGAVSREALSGLLATSENVREVKRRTENTIEQFWLMRICPTWSDFVSRLESIGYNFHRCFLYEGALDVRDLDLRVHVGLSAIVTAIIAPGDAQQDPDPLGQDPARDPAREEIS
jgi:hypothetical protein